jgi:GNAT superfamily N-acetyltransferase
MTAPSNPGAAGLGDNEPGRASSAPTRWPPTRSRSDDLRTALLDEGGDHVCVVTEPVDVRSGGPFEPLRLSEASHLVAGHGPVGRALIAAVAGWARARGCGRVYWHTQASNAAARRLYDQVAENRGFIHYLIDLSRPSPG